MPHTFLTGASSGIGRSLARRIARDEPITLVARRAELLESLAQEIAADGGQATCPVPCDVTDRDAVRAAVATAEARLGPITRLVANAGGGEATTVEDFSSQHVRAVVDLNLMGTVYCIEAVLPGMLERREGHLVAMSSIAGYRGLPGGAAYSASKAALTNLMESLRIDLRPRGVDVTVLAPGFVRTKLANKAKRKRHKPLRMDLEPATELMLRAIQARKPFYAFPTSMRVLVGLGRMLPGSLYDRMLAGRGPGK